MLLILIIYEEIDDIPMFVGKIYLHVYVVLSIDV